MRPRQVAFISLLLGLSVAAGAFAAMRTVELGVHGKQVNARAERKVIVHRRHQLDRFEASLRAALHTHPHRLPHLPHFKPVPKPSTTSLASSARSSAATPSYRTTSAPPAPTARVIYMQPRKVITLHRHGGENDLEEHASQAGHAGQEGNAGQGGGGDD